MTSYFVDFTDGADTNAGTSSGAPWKHCPGGSDATVTSGGVFTSATATFQTDGVTAGMDYVYIYHNKDSVTGTWVESTGLFAVASVDSETQLTLSGFAGRAWATAELPYIIIRPITYKAAVGWGAGVAV